jgi:hypothetical protein
MPRLLRFEAGGIGEYYEGLRTQGGKLVKTVYTSTCSHCGHHSEWETRKRMMDHVEICRRCMRLICLGCYGKPCKTQEQWAEEVELNERLGSRAPEWMFGASTK